MDKKVQEENSNSQNVNYTITSCQRGTSQGSYKILLDDGSSFFLSIDFFLEKKLTKGLVLSQKLLQEIKEESLFVEAYIKAISLLSRQLYTRVNLGRKLESKGLDKNGIEKALAYLEKQGYINDENYATKWIESRIRNKLDSYNSLLAKLMQKGVSNHIAREVLNNVFTEDVNDLIIKKSIEKHRNLNRSADDIIRILCRKGFSISKVKKLLNEDV